MRRHSMVAIAVIGLSAAVVFPPRITAQVPSTAAGPEVPSTTAVSGPAPPGTTPAPLPAGPLVPGSTSPTAPDAPPATWTVAFGGDTLLTRAIGPTTNPFEGIEPPLAEADIAIVNLETAVSTRGRAQVKTFTFRSPPRFADLLAEAGVDVVSLANNHSLDYGIDALNDTRENLDRAGVAHVGAGVDLDDALTPALLEVAGTRVAVLGASQIIPDGSWPATASRPGIASAGKHAITRETQRLIAAVRQARAESDVVLVVLHWGIEGDPCPSPVQRSLGRLLVDAGATAVLGAHPHILQPIRLDNGPTGNVAIAYSLGNFIWDPRSGATADTGVLELRFAGSQLQGAVFHPHRLDGRGWARAVPPRSDAARRITSRVTGRCPGVTGTPVSAG